MREQTSKVSSLVPGFSVVIHPCSIENESPGRILFPDERKSGKEDVIFRLIMKEKEEAEVTNFITNFLLLQKKLLMF